MTTAQRGRNARTWDSFKVGEKIETVGRTIESGDVSLFAGLSGDFNPVHVNEVYASQGIYGARIAHGLLTLAVTSGQINGTGMFEGTTVGFLGLNNVKFSNPVRFGDTILTTVTVTDVRASSKPGRGIVAMTIDVVNQKNETVLTYEQALLMAA